MIRVTNEPDLKEYELPFNWTKQCKRRKSGNAWDVYITHGSSGKRFRSNVAIDDYLTNNPEVKCNRELTNCKYTLILFYKEHMIKKTSWTFLDFIQSLLIFVA